MKEKSVRIKYNGGSYAAPDPNDVWNLPPDVHEVRGELRTVGMWGIPVSYKALAMTCEFGEFSTPKNTKAFGVRTLTHVKESGHVLEGRVSIGGKKYRAFTASALFERADGSLCDVATIFVCMGG